MQQHIAPALVCAGAPQKSQIRTLIFANGGEEIFEDKTA
jgi:hypothetical protein